MIGDVQFIQFTDQLAYLVIQECDDRRIGRLRHRAVHIMPLRIMLLIKETHSILVQIDLKELIRYLQRCMRKLHRQIEKKWNFSMFFYKSQSFPLHHFGSVLHSFNRAARSGAAFRIIIRNVTIQRDTFQLPSFQIAKEKLGIVEVRPALIKESKKVIKPLQRGQPLRFGPSQAPLPEGPGGISRILENSRQREGPLRKRMLANW